MVAAFVPASAQDASTVPDMRNRIAQPAPNIATVRGQIRDSAGNPVSFATVRWGAERRATVTSDSGIFELRDIPPGTTHFAVRRMGYIPTEFDLELRAGYVKPVVVNLNPIPSQLSEVEIAASAETDDDKFRASRFQSTGFFDRASRLHGYFITPAEVERRHPSYFSDLMYGVPGVAMTGRPHTPSVRYQAAAQNCKLQIYLDGHPIGDGDDFAASIDIKAVEVYRSLLDTPEKFSPSPQKGYCGSIVVWTK